MPKRSFVKTVLGRPSRSYAKEAVSPWSDEPSYMNGTGGRPNFDLHLAGVGRRAGSDIAYAGPSRSYLASPPASDLGIPSASRRRPKKASSDVGFVPSASNYSIHSLSRRPIIEDERESASEYSEVSESCQHVPPAVGKRQLAPKKHSVRHPHFADRVEYMGERSRDPPPLRIAGDDSPASSDTQTSSATVSALMSPTSSVTVTAGPVATEIKPKTAQPLFSAEQRMAHETDTGSVPVPSKSVPTKPTKGVRFETPPSPPTQLTAVAEVAEDEAPTKNENPRVSMEGSLDSHDAFYTPRSSVESNRSQQSTESDVKTPLAQVTEVPILPVLQVQPPTPGASSDISEPRFPPPSPTKQRPSVSALATRERDQRPQGTTEEGDDTDESGSYEEHVSHTTYASHEAYDSESANPGALARPPLPRKSSKRPKVRTADEPSTSTQGDPEGSSAHTKTSRAVGVTASGLTIELLSERPSSRASDTTQRPSYSRAASDASAATVTLPKTAPQSPTARKEPQLQLISNKRPGSGPSPPSSRPMSRASSMSQQSQYSQNSEQLSATGRPGFGSEMSYNSSFSQRSGQSTASIPASQSSRGANGKGGWAAARATPVVMYMPTTANDGWAAFQPLPPRSRAAPLPGPHKRYDHDPHPASAANSSVGGSTSGSVRGGAESSASYNDYAGPLYLPKAMPTSVNMPLHHAGFSPPQSPIASQVNDLPSGGPRIMAPSPVRLPQRAMPPPVMPEAAVQDSDSDTDSDDSLPKPSRSYVSTSSGPASPAKISRSSSGSGSRSPSPFATMNRDRRRSLPSTSSVTSAASVRSSRKSWMPPGPVPPVPPIPASIASTLSRPSGPPSLTMNGIDQSLRPLSPTTRASLERPSALNPDVLTLLPEMSVEDSNLLYGSQGKHSRPSSEVGGLTRHRSLFSRSPRQVKIDKPMSDVGHRRASSEAGHGFRATRSEMGGAYAQSEGGHGNPTRPFSPAQSVHSIPGRPFSPAHSLKRAEDGTIDLNGWDAVSSAAEIPVMESHGRDHNVTNGYTSLLLPRGGGYKPDDPLKTADSIDPRILGMPTSAMAAVTFSSSAYTKARQSKEAPTPQHLQHLLPSPVDFTSHLKPPTKVTKHQILLQVYAVAVDAVDQHACETKTEADVGKWIPGRSFVGRAVTVGADELDIRRGDIIIGLTDVRKSGALAEYMVVERRRVARAPANAQLSLEQLAALPSQGISAYRALQGSLSGVRSALIMDAHVGIPALLCQQMRRQGISVTAVVPGGDSSPDATAQAYNNGARACLSGLPHQIMNGLEEGLFDVIVDTRGGEQTYVASARVLAEGGLIISLAGPAPEGMRQLKRRGTFKRMFTRAPRPPRFEQIHPAGDGEAEVGLAGQDVRDVLEDPNFARYEPVIGEVVPFERAPETFVYKPGTDHRLTANIVRIIN